jgi:hypothetical protein
MKRLNHHAQTRNDALEYLLTRARQLMSRGYNLDNIEYRTDPYEHATAVFSRDGQWFKALYLAPNARGAGSYKLWNESFLPNVPVVTIKACQIAGYLGFNNIEHVVERGPFDSTAYSLIEKYYGDRKPKRANVWLMNHIDEGLAILSEYGADPRALETFCLHPLIQSDDDLKHNAHLVEQWSLENWAGAFEYRNVANAYLSDRDISSFSEIRLSPLEYVNEALVADKIQNYKDFMLHHNDHPKRERLFNYFHNWFDALDISAKFIVDMLTMLYDNEVMNAVNKQIPVHRIPTILTHTRLEREKRETLR